MQNQNRLQVFRHKDQTIVLLDLSHMQDEKEIIEVLKMRSNVNVPHCLLVDLTHTHFTRNTVREAKEGAKDLKPLLKAVAAVGGSGMLNVMLPTVSKFSGVKISAFSNREEAIDWLAEQ